ncbi:hypothetical protein RRG08_063770 [Elysia crispata]|uniref:Uncharacterized protein n=1 Tax=Elysia crispata TaxID=231223 RepID=A0AAE1AJN9_9GAST|nr:hypothetical protein RRG08_063770 [Elysia crispata]
MRRPRARTAVALSGFPFPKTFRLPISREHYDTRETITSRALRYKGDNHFGNTVIQGRQSLREHCDTRETITSRTLRYKGDNHFGNAVIQGRRSFQGTL